MKAGFSEDVGLRVGRFEMDRVCVDGFCCGFRDCGSERGYEWLVFVGVEYGWGGGDVCGISCTVCLSSIFTVFFLKMDSY